jgi:hypothetical protein
MDRIVSRLNRAAEANCSGARCLVEAPTAGLVCAAKASGAQQRGVWMGSGRSQDWNRRRRHSLVRRTILVVRDVLAEILAVA